MPSVAGQWGGGTLRKPKLCPVFERKGRDNIYKKGEALFKMKILTYFSLLFCPFLLFVLSDEFCSSGKTKPGTVLIYTTAILVKLLA